MMVFALFLASPLPRFSRYLNTVFRYFDHLLLAVA